MASFELGKKVVIITDKGPTYDAIVIGRAKGDSGGPGAYKVTPSNIAAGHPGQWYKAADVFLPEPTEQEKKDSWDDFLKEE